MHYLFTSSHYLFCYITCSISSNLSFLCPTFFPLPCLSSHSIVYLTFPYLTSSYLGLPYLVFLSFNLCSLTLPSIPKSILALLYVTCPTSCPNIMLPFSYLSFPYLASLSFTSSHVPQHYHLSQNVYLHCFIFSYLTFPYLAFLSFTSRSLTLPVPPQVYLCITLRHLLYLLSIHQPPFFTLPFLTSPHCHLLHLSLLLLNLSYFPLPKLSCYLFLISLYFSFSHFYFTLCASVFPLFSLPIFSLIFYL